MKIARAKSKPSRAGGKENQNSIFATSVAILHNVMYCTPPMRYLCAFYKKDTRKEKKQ